MCTAYTESINQRGGVIIQYTTVYVQGATQIIYCSELLFALLTRALAEKLQDIARESERQMRT